MIITNLNQLHDQLQGVKAVRKHLLKSKVKINILKEPLLVQKQTLHQQKALDLSYLELKGQGRAWLYHEGVAMSYKTMS